MTENKKILKTKIGLITFRVSVIHLIFSFYLYFEYELMGTNSSEAQGVVSILRPLFIAIYIVPNFLNMYRISDGYFKGKELSFYKVRKVIFFLIIVILLVFILIKDSLEFNLISILVIGLPLIQQKLCQMTYNEMTEKRKELNNNKEEDIENYGRTS